MPGGHIHRVHVIAVDEGVELGGGRRGLVPARREQRQLLALLELLQVEDGLGVEAHAGQSLGQDGGMETGGKEGNMSEDTCLWGWGWGGGGEGDSDSAAQSPQASAPALWPVSLAWLGSANASGEEEQLDAKIRSTDLICAG